MVACYEVMMRNRYVVSVIALSIIAFGVGCGNDRAPLPPSAPTPPPSVTANAYILPGAVTLGAWAFGDEPVVIFTGERLRWVNGDALTHAIVADSPEATDFRETGELSSGAAQTFVMTKLGTTTIHCPIHPSMTGTLIVRER